MHAILMNKTLLPTDRENKLAELANQNRNMYRVAGYCLERLKCRQLSSL